MSLSMSVLRDGRSRSISPENPTGGKGAGGGATTGTGAAAARDLGPGWKVSPSVDIAAGGTHTVADIAPYLGLPQVLRPDGLYQSQQRFGMYRWHLPDPVRFSTDLRVTIQALGVALRRAVPAAAR